MRTDMGLCWGVPDLSLLKGWGIGMLLSQKLLRQMIGALWLIDGLLQVQPQMFTSNMVYSVLLPTLQSQPAPVAANLREIIIVITQHLTIVNLLIAVIQAEIGLLLLTGIWVRGAVIASIVWALIVWYGGEGMSMLLTGQASIITGAPGAVLFYPLLGLLVYPRTSSSKDATAEAREAALLSRTRLRWILAGFWFFAALLQLQPYWWQSGQISQAISDMVGQGGFDRILVDPILQPLGASIASLEIPLNSILIVVFLGLGIALAVAQQRYLRPLLTISMVLSFTIWWMQAFGMIFTGMATDFNSGLLLILMALACWPRTALLFPAQKQTDHDVQPSEDSVLLARPAGS
jgi:hypothetical protein